MYLILEVRKTKQNKKKISLCYGLTKTLIAHWKISATMWKKIYNLVDIGMKKNENF